MLFQTRPSLIFGTPIKIFFIKSESFLTLYRHSNTTYMFKAQKGSKKNMKIVHDVTSEVQQEYFSDRKEKKLLNKVVILVFFVHKKNSRSFITLLLNHRYIILMFFTIPFWALNVLVVLLSRKLLDFIKNILICVLKINDGHEGN